MKTQFSISARKILSIWVAFVAMFTTALLVLPHSEMTPALFLILAIEVLLLLITIAIVRHEPSAKNKFIFANFGAFFMVSLLGVARPFIGMNGFLLTEFKFAGHLFDQYAIYGAYSFFLAFAIVYLAVDTLFRDFQTAQKYLITFAIAGTFFAVYFNPFLVNPMYSYETQDARDFHQLDSVARAYTDLHGIEPTPTELAGLTKLFVYKDGREVATLHDEARLARVEELVPYMEGANYMALVMKPIYMYMIYMGVLTIGFILMFFGYQYMKDPPQGAYIEKMIFLFLLFTSMDILHSMSYIKQVEWATFASIVDAGQYATAAVLFLIAVFFGLRLRFIMSAKGEFYETELEVRPAGITRWRDAFDTMVVESFFNRKIVHGRLFAPQGRSNSDPGH